MKYEEAFGSMIDTITKKSEVPTCLTCGEVDTYKSNGDCGWCSECHTVEGDWDWGDE